MPPAATGHNTPLMLGFSERNALRKRTRSITRKKVQIILEIEAVLQTEG